MGEKNPTSFFHVTSTNIGITPKIFLACSFNPFATLVQNFKATPNANPKLLNWAPLRKILIFWSNPYKTEVVTTSLIEILEKFSNQVTKLADIIKISTMFI